MREYETVTETKTVKKFKRKICCLCKRTVSISESDNWHSDDYTTDRVTIEREWGRVYPEGGETEFVKLDICPDCFDRKLLKFLVDQGVTCEIITREY